MAVQAEELAARLVELVAEQVAVPEVVERVAESTGLPAPEIQAAAALVGDRPIGQTAGRWNTWQKVTTTAVQQALEAARTPAARQIRTRLAAEAFLQW